MTKFAVGFFTFYDNELRIEIIETDHWRNAAALHTKTPWTHDEDDIIENERNDVPNTIKEAKLEALNLHNTAFDIIIIG